MEETTCGEVGDLARISRQGKGKCQQSSHAIFSTAFPHSQSLTHVPWTLHRNDREDSGETFSPCRTCLLPSPASTHLSPSERRPQPRYEVSLLPALASFGLLSSRPSFKPAFFQAGLLSSRPSFKPAFFHLRLLCALCSGHPTHHRRLLLQIHHDRRFSAGGYPPVARPWVCLASLVPPWVLRPPSMLFCKHAKLRHCTLRWPEWCGSTSRARPSIMGLKEGWKKPCRRIVSGISTAEAGRRMGKTRGERRK